MSVKRENNKYPLRTDLSIAQQFATVPNILTLLRIVLFFVLVHFLVIASNTGRFVPAIVTGSIMLLTDILDGIFARFLNQATFVGSILDPVSDKLIVAGLGITLFVLDYIPFWLIVLILLRDLIIIVLGIDVIRSRKELFPASFLTRLTPFAWGVSYIFFVADISFLAWTLGFIALFLTGFSGFEYLRDYVLWKRGKSN